MIRYYITADFALRSDELADLFEDSDIQSEVCEYGFSLLEDFFYKISKSEDSIYVRDKQIAEENGNKITTKVIKDEDGNSLIEWSRPGRRFYLDIEDIDELQEFICAINHLDVRLMIPDVTSFGMPELPEDSYGLEIIGDCDCEECRKELEEE